MTEDKEKIASDGHRIFLGEDYDVREWCKDLRCTPQQLREALRTVGNSADAVRQHLATRK